MVDACSCVQRCGKRTWRLEGRRSFLPQSCFLHLYNPLCIGSLSIQLLGFTPIVLEFRVTASNHRSSHLISSACDIQPSEHSFEPIASFDKLLSLSSTLVCPVFSFGTTLIPSQYNVDVGDA